MFGIARLNTLAKFAAASRTAKTITNGGGAAVSTTQSKFGGASLVVSLSASTSTHFVSIDSSSTSADLNIGTGAFTYEAWFYPVANGGSSSTQASIIEGRSAANDGSSLGIYHNATNNLVVGALGTSTAMTSSQTVALNTWHHVALTRSGTTWTLWVNGASGATATSSTSISNPNIIRVGRGYVTTATFRGYIDEVRISNTARYTGAFTPSASAFTNDANTVFLMHANGTNGATTFTDDNA